MNDRKIAVVGGGLMGAAIAQCFADAGFTVRICEPVEEARSTLIARIAKNIRSIGGDPSIVDRITVHEMIADTVSDAFFVTEAAPEKIELKRSIFREMISYAPSEAILASNSSVMPIGSISAGLDTADRIVGTHWWNPAHLIPLVEVIQGAQTSDATVNATMQLLAEIGKKPAHVKKDVAGFVANRLQHALWREAIAMVAEGICDAKTLDDCVKNSFGLRLPVLGPLENADLVGLDLTQDIHRTIIPELDVSCGPNPILQQYIDAGKLGFKTGEGFRVWSELEMEALRSSLTQHLLRSKEQREKQDHE